MVMVCTAKCTVYVHFLYKYRGRILGRNWDKSPWYSHSPLLTNFSPPLEQKWLKLVYNVNDIYGNLKSEITPRNLNEIVYS